MLNALQRRNYCSGNNWNLFYIGSLRVYLNVNLFRPLAFAPSPQHVCANSSLDVTRSFVPLNIFEASSSILIEMGFTLEVARRLLEKKALWLTRMSETEIAKLHEADLHNRFQVK